VARLYYDAVENPFMFGEIHLGFSAAICAFLVLTAVCGMAATCSRSKCCPCISITYYILPVLAFIFATATTMLVYFYSTDYIQSGCKAINDAKTVPGAPGVDSLRQTGYIWQHSLFTMVKSVDDNLPAVV
jgi:hypothetical protein